MENVKSNRTSLTYQKQLFNTLDQIVSFRTNLIKNAALVALEGKEKEWPSIHSQVKFVKKQVEKTDDPNLKTISKIAIALEDFALELEKQLELKNTFCQTIQDQSLKELPPAEII